METFLAAFCDIVKERKSFSIESYYKKEHTEDKGFGSIFQFGETAD